MSATSKRKKKSERIVKVVMLGNTAVGKTSLSTRFAYDEFKEDMESTIGASFITRKIPNKQYKLGSNLSEQIRFDVWDTAGQERYRCMLPMYYRSAQAAIICLDVSTVSSFHGAKDWIKELTENCHTPGLIRVLACNKCDLENQPLLVDSKVKDYAAKNGLLYFETSARTGDNVLEMFERISEALPTEIPEALLGGKTDKNKNNITLKKEGVSETKCCQ